MSNRSSWKPLTSMVALSTAMDQLFNSAYLPSAVRGSQWLPIDMLENEDAFTLHVVVPGIDPNNLDITVNDRSLTIRGTWQQPELPQGATFHLYEWGTGQFERTVQFPVQLACDAVQAQYASGILTLTLPKVEAVKPRRISIQGQAQQLETDAQPELEEQAVGA